jgi:hypothetical protein
MSTRSNIIIKNNNEIVKTLYKHHDGYIAGVGVDLVRYLIPLKTYRHTEPRDLLSVLSNKYEVTTGIHGDIEYLYTISFNEGNIKMVVQSGDAFQNLRKRVEHLLYTYEYKTKQENIYILEQDMQQMIDLDDKATLNEVRKIYDKGLLKND